MTSFPAPRTVRDQVESVLRVALDEALRPLDASAIETLERHKDGSFGLSYLSLLLYCNGWNLRSYSTHHPRGLLYRAPAAIFGVGCFAFDDDQPTRGGAHLVAPRGRDAEVTAASVATCIRREFPHLPVYARHLEPELYRTFLDAGRWLPIDAAPWDEAAPSEDETYCHRRIRLADLIELDGQGHRVQVLETGGSRSFRRKAHLAHNRFGNFLARERLRYRLVPLTEARIPDASEIVARHFAAVSASRELIGSSFADYKSLVRMVPSPEDGRFHCRVGYLEGEGWRQPVSFFAAERLGHGGWGCYATISRRDPDLLPSSVDPRGFSAIAQFALLELFAELLRAGAEWVDLGGSETPELDRFKRQLGARHHPTHWAVFDGR